MMVAAALVSVSCQATANHADDSILTKDSRYAYHIKMIKQTTVKSLI